MRPLARRVSRDEFFSVLSRRTRFLGFHDRSPANNRDVILPGEMKDLMIRVAEAKNAAEANLIARREEMAAAVRWRKHASCCNESQ